MARRYDLIIFDWDGTLIDSIQKIVDCFQVSFSQSGLPLPDPEAIKQLIGLPLTHAFETLTKNANKAKLTELAQNYRNIWLSGRVPTSPLFPGVHNLLKQLDEEGYQLAIATGKSRVGLDRELKHHGLTHLFGHTRCSEETRAKPHPEMLLELLGLYRSDANRALMVGDTTMDLDMANAAGLASVAVSTGGHTRSQLEASRPKIVLENILDLKHHV